MPFSAETLSISDLIIAAAIGSFGAALALYLSALLAQPLLASMVGSRQSIKLKRAAARIKAADKMIDSHSYGPAVAELKRAILLDPSFPAAMLSAVRDHNQNVLSRCVTIAEEINARPSTLPEVERLLLERIELQRLQLKAAAAFDKLRSRRKEAGKDVPNWSQSDFSGRINEIAKELEKNTTELNKALQTLFSEIVLPSHDSVTIH